MKRAIVTGPTGAVGMALLKELSEQGVQVAAVVRPDSKRADRIENYPMVTKFACGLEHIEELPRLLQKAGWDGTDSVFYHLGWDGTFGNSRNNMHGQNLNVKYALDAADAAAACGCSTFVGAGSQAEYGRFSGKLNKDTPTFPENGYGMAKLCAGQMTRVACEQHQMRHIWTRILSIYGPFDGDATMVMSTIDKLLAGAQTAFTKGEQQWDYLYSQDAALALRLLGDKGVHGRTYCIGSGKVQPLCEYIKTIRDIVRPEAKLGFGQIAYAPKQVMYLCADISDLQADTGFAPQWSFEDGIRETVEWRKMQ